jgi:hypothetical protein
MKPNAKSRPSRFDKRPAPFPARSRQRPFLSFSSAWILGQRLGCLGWAIAETDPARGEGKARKLARLSREFVEQLTELGRVAGSNALVELPLSVLEVCTDPAVAERVPEAAGALRQMQDLLAWYKQQRGLDQHDDRGQAFRILAASPAEAAAIIAHMVLFSDLPALPLIGALKFFVSSDYAGLLGDAKKVDELQGLLDLVRSPALSTDRIAGAARQIAALIDRPDPGINYAIPIKNALLDALLAWPLLYYRNPGETRNEPRAGCLSLPLVVDVSFDGKSRVALNTRLCADNEKHRHPLQRLTEQVERAFDIAKQLWLSKNGHSHARLEEVREASCTIDFRLAEEVCRSTPILPIWTERSAEAYLVQFLLSRLIGRQVGLTAGISGKIGDRIPERRRKPSADSAVERFSVIAEDPELIGQYIAARRNRNDAFVAGTRFARDWLIDRIGGPEAKFRYARASKKYHKLILPPSNQVNSDGDPGQGYLEVNYARSLVSAADAAQLGGWRQHGYTRCPDLGHLIHTEPELLPPVDHPFVEETRQALLDAGTGAVRLDSGHAMLSIAALLGHLNFDYRFRQRAIAPSLSWELLRAVPDELNTRFWHTFLKAIGASDLAIKEHCLRNSTEFTADLIVSILNGGYLAERLGCHAPPDLVVVFAASHLWSEGLSDVERKEVPLDAKRVFEAISERPIEPLRAPYCDRIGSSRIIFLDDDQYFRNSKYFQALLEPDEDRDALFERLSLFERGFSLQMARHAAGDLASDIVHLRSMVYDLVRAGALWRHGGVYFLPHALRSSPPKPSLELAATYKTLANSLMPGLGQSASSGFGPAECFEVDIVREAQFFLKKALEVISLAMKEGAQADQPEVLDRLNDLRRIIQCEQGLHLRFFEMPTWGVMIKLIKNPISHSPLDLLNYAESLLARARDLGTADPRSFSCCAQAAKRVIYAAWVKGDHVSAERYFWTMSRYFDEAEAIANSYPEQSNRNDWLMHVLTWKIGTMRDYNRRAFRVSKKDKSRRLRTFPRSQISECNDKIATIFSANPESGIFPDVSWHAEAGDYIEQDSAASSFYRYAARIQPKFGSCYLKAFATMDGKEIRDFLNAEPGYNFWSKRVREALAWYEMNREQIARIPITAVARDRMIRGEIEIRRRLKLM